MTNFYSTRVIALIASLAVIAFAALYAIPAFSAPAIRDENNIPAVFGSSCDTATASTVAIGNQASTEIQGTTTDRAYLRIEQPLNATNTVSISINDVAAVIGRGLQLSNATTSNETNFHEFGLTTVFPYTGAVKAITSTGSTTVVVTTCTY